MKRGVRKSVAYLRTRRFYAHLNRHYAHREIPLSGQNDAILRFEEEDQVLGRILKLVKRPPLCLARDGAIADAINIGDVVRIGADCMAAAMDLGVGIAVRRWVPLPHIEGERRLVDTRANPHLFGSSDPGGLLVKISCVNMSLYISVRFRHLADVYVVPTTSGPFSAPHFDGNPPQT